MDHHIIAAYAQVAATAGVGLLQLGIVGRWLWRNGKYLEKRRLVLDAQAERFAVLGRELAATHRMLGEELAQSRARRARTAGGSHD